MRIYICARNMHHEETAKIASFLEKHGHMVYYAAKDTYQSAPADQIFLNNLVLIRNSDVFIAYFTKDGHYGIDFAVEVGMAAETGKPIIGYIDLGEEQLGGFYRKFEKDIMFSGAFTKMFTDLEEFAKFLLLI
jgi:nucleoside 2-deoxyribosyltransferase